MDAKNVRYSNRPLTIGEWADFMLIRLQPNNPMPMIRLLGSRADPPLRIRQIREMPLADLNTLMERMTEQLPQVMAIQTMENALRKGR